MLEDDPETKEMIKIVTWQHHERQDGRGYPEGLRGDQINKHASIVAVADIYDALTTNQPYRKMMPFYKAMRIVIMASGNHLKKEIVGVFLSVMSIYPQGTFVRLNTNEIAIVISANRRAIIRPVIKLLVDSSGQKFKEDENVVAGFTSCYTAGEPFSSLFAQSFINPLL